MGFEAKASLSDYRNGFNAGADKTYIIAPKGIIPYNEIPKGIGFYEVDLKNYKISIVKNKGIVLNDGIKLIKRASSRHKNRQYRTKLLMLTYIAQRVTNMDIYNNCKIKMIIS